MRWPLRYQVLLPFVLLILATLAAVSALNAYVSARRQRERVQNQLRDVAATLAESRFPLTDAVLRQTHALSGAHFIVEDGTGRAAAASDARFSDVPPTTAERLPSELTLNEPIALAGERFFHAAVKLRPRFTGDAPRRLHILYPEQTWRQAWHETVYPPLVTGAVALLLAAGISALIAARVTRPISRLRSQVERIARGHFQPLPEPRGGDETGDLARAVNRMAEMLAAYEQQVRRHERLRALGQLRGGLAHQLRNAVTGCRIALDLYRRRLADAGRDDESLDVANRQLTLIEKQLEQFLKFGVATQDTETSPQKNIDLRGLAAGALALVAPAAEHMGVQLNMESDETTLTVHGDAEALEQMLVNLLLNAIEATSARREQPAAGDNTPPCVRLHIEQAEPDRAALCVADNGPGPGTDIQSRLFEPLVTGKPEGTGLGLAVARDIARSHGGDIVWRREDGWTHFVVELPTHSTAPNEPTLSHP